MDEVLPVPFIEGLAAVGLVKSFRVEECGIPKRKRIVVETVDGKRYTTRCIDERGARRVVLALAEYKNLSRLIVEEVSWKA